ncbi:MAG TPA: NAD(P)H-dependent oxidoreductase subunit E, partial [Actinomycetota bacterium]|nr:NAD(P)H-dependent oxidoreductase subunit E [Actinomycetota bacterium]
MDLVMPDALASDDERSAVDAVLGAATSGWSGGSRVIESEGRVARGGHEAREQRHLLLPVLHALQSSAGWISPGGLRYACERLTVPPAEAYGVATFYAMFSVEPRSTTVLHLCDDIACRVAGAEDLIDEVVREAGPERVLRSPCLGMCERAPAALLQTGDSNDVAFGPVSIERLDPFLDGGPPTMTSGPEAGEVAPQTGGTREGLRLLRRVGVVDPTSLDDYRAHGGYEALRR